MAKKSKVLKKLCLKCGKRKHVTEFHKDKLQKDGIFYYCKKCKRKLDNARNALPEFKKKKKAWHENHREQSSNAVGKWSRSNRIKKNAHNKVYAALKSGELVKLDYCEICFESGELQAHHEDYNKPLKVVWLCSECHGKIHRKEAS